MKRNKFTAWLLVVSLIFSMFSTSVTAAYAEGQDFASEENVTIDTQPVNEDELTDIIEEELTDTVTEIDRDPDIDTIEPEEVFEDSTDFELPELNRVFASATLSPKEQLEKNLAYIHRTVNNPVFGTLGGEWSILSLARGNYPVSDGYYDIYYKNVVDEVQKLILKYNGNLDRSKGTENSRLILGLTSIGKDIRNVGGYDLRNTLADYNFVIKQGINGPIFALIALDSHNYEIPIIEGVATQTTRDNLIEYILDREIKKGTADAGGWALGVTNPDPDITAMAIQGLTPYYNDRQDVKAAVDRAIDWFSKAQTDDGGFASWGSVNSESIAQVVVALTGLGIDPHTDPRFIKNGQSAIDALLTFAVPDGGFMHVKPGGAGNGGAAPGVVDGMATDQGTYALVAYDRLVNNQTRLYDMTDVQLESPGEPEGPKEPEDQEDPIFNVPDNNDDYPISIKPEDSNKEITINIPVDKKSKVLLNLPLDSNLPKIEALKGNVSVLVSKGTQVKDGNASSLEWLTSRDRNDRALINQIQRLIPGNKKLDSIAQAVTMGGDSRVTFDDFVTITFAGMKGMDAAYIEKGLAHPIQKFASDSESQNRDLDEYAYDSGNDLIVRTKHFTDFVVYSAIPAGTGTPGGGTGGGDGGNPSKHYVTLSIDKETINKGYVLGPTKVEIQPGDNVWEVSKREMDKQGISYDFKWYDMYGSVYVQSIAGDGEFDHGSGSGWMYNVNGNYPNYGASKYVLSDGDVIQWRYTTNLGADLGEDLSKWEPPAGGGTGGGAGGGAGGAGAGASDQDRSTDPKAPSKGAEHNTVFNLEQKFADASSISSWAYEAIKRATQKGFITGSNGQFKPKSDITRAEFTKILVSVLELDVKTGKAINFTDVAQGDWFYPYINAASKAGLISGYNHQFKPNDNITREQMAAIIVRALGIQPAKSSAIIKDIDAVSAWAKSDVETVVALQLMVGNDNKFSPQAYVTREMAAVVAMRAYDYKKGKKPEASKEDEPKNQTEYKAVQQQIQDTAAFMQKTIPNPVVASIGGEWTVLGLARSGVKVPDEYYAKYYANLEKTLKDKSGKLHHVKYTEYDRVILALTSIGKNIDNVAGYDLREPLADFDTLIKQGINGPIFALIALDSKHYDIPIVQGVKTQTTRELLIDFILKREIDGGGWALGEKPSAADPDITAMAIQGLAPYYSTNAEVKAAVDRGLAWLSKVQAADGGFASWGSINSESIAQVIVALTSLGIDPHTDARFIKNGNSAVDALLSYAVPGGGFYHVKPGGTGNGGAKPGEVDPMATDQAMYALVAYDRFVKGQNRLYDMTDVTKPLVSHIK